MDKVELKMLLAIPLDQPIPYLVTPSQLITMLANTDGPARALWTDAVERGIQQRLLEVNRSLQSVTVKPPARPYRIPQQNGRVMLRTQQPPDEVREVESITIEPMEALDWLRAIEMTPPPPAVQLWLDSACEMVSGYKRETIAERNTRWANGLASFIAARSVEHGAKRAYAKRVAATEKVNVATVERCISDVPKKQNERKKVVPQRATWTSPLLS